MSILLCCVCLAVTVTFCFASLSIAKTPPEKTPAAEVFVASFDTAQNVFFTRTPLCEGGSTDSCRINSSGQLLNELKKNGTFARRTRDLEIAV